MNERSNLLASLGFVLALGGYILNEIFLRIALEGWRYNPPGSIPHSGPVPVGTIFMFFIPLGALLFVVSIIIEIKHRKHRNKVEIWNSH